jgi:hypothetical protein
MEYSDEYYKQKYLKYKTKYEAELFKQYGGSGLVNKSAEVLNNVAKYLNPDLAPKPQPSTSWNVGKNIAITAGVAAAGYVAYEAFSKVKNWYNTIKQAEQNKINNLKYNIIQFCYTIGLLSGSTPVQINVELLMDRDLSNLVIFYKNLIVQIINDRNYYIRSGIYFFGADLNPDIQLDNQINRQIADRTINIPNIIYYFTFGLIAMADKLHEEIKIITPKWYYYNKTPQRILQGDINLYTLKRHTNYLLDNNKL